jgi:hypothetical protein
MIQATPAVSISYAAAAWIGWDYLSDRRINIWPALLMNIIGGQAAALLLE